MDSTNNTSRLPNSTSSLFKDMESTGNNAKGGEPAVTISGGGFGDSVGTNLNRAYAWFVAGIVASVIVSILLVIAMYVFGFAPNLSAVLGHSPLKAGLVFIAALVIGFATAGSVYEGWVGCKV
jgi:hypothetical protein